MNVLFSEQTIPPKTGAAVATVGDENYYLFVARNNQGTPVVAVLRAFDLVSAAREFELRYGDNLTISGVTVLPPEGAV